MSNQTYSVIFRGDIVIGCVLSEVKAKLKKIFKADDARIDGLFSGKAVTLKHRLTLSEAERYRSILNQAGVIVSIEACDDGSLAQTASQQSIKELERPSHQASEMSKDEWQLAPVGTRLSDKKVKEEEALKISLDHLTVLPQEGHLLKDNERQQEASAAVDMESLDWELTPYGELLLRESEKKSTASVEIDTSNLSLAEAKGNLIKSSEKSAPKPLQIDTSHLRLVDREE